MKEITGWETCSKCKGKCGLDNKPCRRCGNMGRVLAKGYKLCPECGGFGSVGFDPDDPQDMGSFQEDCRDCKGSGAVKK